MRMVGWWWVVVVVVVVVVGVVVVMVVGCWLLVFGRWLSVVLWCVLIVAAAKE